MTPELREKYENVARVLRTLNPAEFDLDVWGERGSPGCGTRACIAGWCALDPWFRERGFSASFDENGDLIPDTGFSFIRMIREFFELDANIFTGLPNEFLRLLFGYEARDDIVISLSCLGAALKTPHEIADALSSWLKEQETSA